MTIEDDGAPEFAGAFVFILELPLKMRATMFALLDVELQPHSC